jgi:hypothetical protein
VTTHLLGAAESLAPVPVPPVEELPVLAPLVEASVLVPAEPAEDLLFAPAEAPDDFSFVAFLAFLAFFLAFGFASVVASVLPAAVPDVAAGEDDVPLVLPAAPGLVDDAPELVPVVSVVSVEVPVVDEPDAPVPLVPEAPDDVSLLPEVPGWPVLGGMALEVPLPPAMPASLPVPAPVAPVAFCDLTVGDGSAALLLLDCASAMEDTDATMANDSTRRVVFNVMSNSFELKKRHHRCSSLDATLVRLFSKFHSTLPQNPLDFLQVVEFKDILTM